ncbi:hypothetical protein A2966_02805 [Candidatus Roizmanbacteria bacterium RIFCSPLOWO2_01_FULL_41_22]|uniref:Uncharacterized protein n=2 Tax=Candidatus Roizmaniibacteriota TaxID=1752723 RepID=A0A1F7JRC2_9BACT|nr:MAG: hypothetical protein A2966_02805 [Candidatus Roizmanbacteria bacterium RIFCSPLOWO2_01_FULL_41_22]OGK58141.1 MAG: hypothetical protein A3H86_04085 [Candidatus Roizmanbacteria bacterium RIFCSPLOWO2_02_FULL_41_9]
MGGDEGIIIGEGITLIKGGVDLESFWGNNWFIKESNGWRVGEAGLLNTVLLSNTVRIKDKVRAAAIFHLILFIIC